MAYNNNIKKIKEGNVKFSADEIWKSSITKVSQKFKNEKKGEKEFKMRFIEK